MELRIRKTNRLQGYDYSKNGAYFVTICTKYRLSLFGAIVGDGVLDVPKMQFSSDGMIVNEQIQSMQNLYLDLFIDKFIVMPNHIHCIITVHAVNNGSSRTPTPTNATIPRFVSTLKRLVNKQIGISVFQRSYHDHIIRNEQEYQKIWNYINTNPQNWEQDCFYIEQHEI